MIVEPLGPADLYRGCDPGSLRFETTEDLEDGGVLGQARALEAIQFGARMERQGYNLYLLGPPGTGKHIAVRKILEDKAAGEDAPADWAYVYNFETPHKPVALRLPAGRGGQLYAATRHLVEDIRAAIPAAFENDEYRSQRQAIEEEFRERQSEAFELMRARAQGKSIAVIRTSMGFALAPLHDSEIIKPEIFEKIPQEERARIEADIAALQGDLEQLIRQAPRWEKERREALRRLNREVTATAVDHPIEELRETFADLPDVLAHLEAMRNDLVENVHTMLGVEDAARGGDQERPQTDGFRRYETNLIVDNAALSAAPVIYEDLPTLPNLLGRVEHLPQMGALVTDFTLIKPGALHRANGGYLILDARKVLTQPAAWEALKRNLKARRITLESLGQMLSLVSTVSLEPEPIPLDIKVCLSGDRVLYYLLSTYDPDFLELFKVAADFDDDMARNEDTTTGYARLIAATARREGLRPLDRAGVARVIEHGSRLAGDAEKLSLKLESLCDLLSDADHFAGEAGANLVSAGHVQAAIDAQIRRADRLRQRAYEMIERDIVLIDTTGARVGQINGLSVLQLGGYAFGRPSRITARVGLGAGKVIDIEREVELGGPLHSKGVLIFSGFLAERFGTSRPLSMSASLVFEQSYGGVEGDSASSAELYALLSALAELPIKQSLAVTGSVNQHGEVQAIGGVNEKIEGFFDICKARGLTGGQGVLIPKANAANLMLRADVVEAVAEARFAIYPVATIDEGIELLTGLPAGTRDAAGAYLEGSANRLVEERLTSFAEARRAFAREGREASGESA